MKTALNFRFLVHNILIHPLAGFAWFVGLASVGDWLHSLCVEENLHDK